MAVYEEIPGVNGGLLSQAEVGIYGSSRLGLWRPMRDVESTNWWLQSQEAMNGTGGISTRSWTRGAMNFELSNHLGNVLVTVSDRRIQVQDNGSVLNPKPVFRFDPDVLTANDYYPFGMLMPGRKFDAGSLYRYGFNGKENDNEVKGEGNQQDYGMRIYDSRLGRFLSVDPLTDVYPWNSPYSYAEGDPVNYIDLDGAEQNGVRSSAATRPTVPVVNVRVDANTLNGQSGGSQRVPAGQMFTNGPINSGAYAPQTRLVTQAELNALIPPGAGAYINNDQVSMTVYNSNGSWRVSLLKAVHKAKSWEQMTWYERETVRILSQYMAPFKGFKQWNSQIRGYEIITTDPKTLDDKYLSEVQKRLIEGNATAQDLIYENELRKRRILYPVNPKHDPSRPNGGANASVLPENHLDLWEKRTTYDAKTDTWWSIEGSGKKAVFHRFSGYQGEYHWTGSTGDNRNRNGGKVKPIRTTDVPVSTKRKAGFKG